MNFQVIFSFIINIFSHVIEFVYDPKIHSSWAWARAGTQNWIDIKRFSIKSKISFSSYYFSFYFPYFYHATI